MEVQECVKGEVTQSGPGFAGSLWISEEPATRLRVGVGSSMTNCYEQQDVPNGRLVA